MKLLAELQRRNVHRAAVFYAGAAWLLVQIATQVFPFFDIPNATVRIVVIAAVVGFPFAMLFSWFYEWTPQGIKLESAIDRSASVTRQTGRRMDRWIIAVLSLAVVLLLANTFIGHRAVAPDIDKSVAVLPLVNNSGDADQLYFSDGLSENLITALSQFSGLKVIGRSSSFRFRNSQDDARIIGTKLGVAHLLEGSVQRAGEMVRISAELVNTSDGSTLWSQRFDRPYHDLFALQDEITNAVASALKAKLLDSAAASQSDRPPSGNLAAYNAYLLGQFHQSRGTEADLREAIRQFDEATRLDPAYARTYAQGAVTRLLLAGGFLGGAEARRYNDEARSLIDHALLLAPDLGGVHAARGFLLDSVDFDWTGAEAEYLRYVELQPEAAWGKVDLAGIQSILGRPDAAIEPLRQALVTDPLQAVWHLFLAQNLVALGRFDEADTALRKAVELAPQSTIFNAWLVKIQVLRGNAAPALAAAQQQPAGGPWTDFAMALALQIGPDHAAADATLKTLIDQHADVAAYQIAEVYALRREPDLLFVWLDRAWTNRDPGVTALLTDPLLLRYRDDPRFSALCKKLGLPTTTTAKALP